jgi:hypothetical protein
MTVGDQIPFCDAGHANHLANIHIDGLTIEAQIRPEAIDGDRPVVTLAEIANTVNYVQWSAGDWYMAFSSRTDMS